MAAGATAGEEPATAKAADEYAGNALSIAALSVAWTPGAGPSNRLMGAAPLLSAFAAILSCIHSGRGGSLGGAPNTDTDDSDTDERPGSEAALAGDEKAAADVASLVGESRALRCESCKPISARWLD